MHRFGTVLAAAALIGIAPVGLQAQTGPPIRGTMALEGTMTQLYRAANVLVVAVIDGAEHVYHFTRDLIVHRGRNGGGDPLDGLREGTRVVVHYVTKGAQVAVAELDRVGDDGLKTKEGVVTQVDRGRKRITIRFDDGATETLELTGRLAAVPADLGPARAPRLVVYEADESGGKVAYSFKPAA
jgi:hypothetical protein